MGKFDEVTLGSVVVPAKDAPGLGPSAWKALALHFEVKKFALADQHHFFELFCETEPEAGDHG